MEPYGVNRAVNSVKAPKSAVNRWPSDTACESKSMARR